MIFSKLNPYLMPSNNTFAIFVHGQVSFTLACTLLLRVNETLSQNERNNFRIDSESLSIALLASNASVLVVGVILIMRACCNTSEGDFLDAGFDDHIEAQFGSSDAIERSGEIGASRDLIDMLSAEEREGGDVFDIESKDSVHVFTKRDRLGHSGSSMKSESKDSSSIGSSFDFYDEPDSDDPEDEKQQQPTSSSKPSKSSTKPNKKKKKKKKKSSKSPQQGRKEDYQSPEKSSSSMVSSPSSSIEFKL